MRSSVHILPGFDVEAPFDQPQHRLEEAAPAVELSLDVIKRINEAFDSCGAPRTFFVLGKFLETAVQLCGPENVKAAFQPASAAVDIESHGYSHRQFRYIPADPSRTPLTPEEVFADIKHASALISLTLGKSPSGLRAPRGYACGLADETGLIKKVTEAGVRFISSDLRDSEWRICTGLSDNGRLRQPYRYPGGLIEIPSHGWQDMAFSGRPIPGIPDLRGYSRKEIDAFILDHYRGLVDQALQCARGHGRPVFIGLCLHPQAVCVYDPEIRLLGSLLNYAADQGVIISSYEQAFNLLNDVSDVLIKEK